jgi:hypothetical protein
MLLKYQLAADSTKFLKTAGDAPVKKLLKIKGSTDREKPLIEGTRGRALLSNAYIR